MNNGCWIVLNNISTHPFFRKDEESFKGLVQTPIKEYKSEL
jgi:hypothetical protein